MNATDFFLKYRGKKLDIDDFPLDQPYQCVDVIKAYFKEVLNRDSIAGNAIDYWRDIPGFTRISRTIFNRPNPGDIIIWNTTSSNPYGHIAICNWSRYFDVGVFGQNDPIGSPCEYKDYPSYKNILGWLRPNPPEFLKSPLEIVGINSPQTLQDAITRVQGYLGHPVTLKLLSAQYSVPDGQLGTDQAQTILQGLSLGNAIGCYLFYPYNPHAAFEVASYDPKKNVSFATLHDQASEDVMVHACLHLFRKYLNANHIGQHIEDVELYPANPMNPLPNDPGWRFIEQYEELKKYIQ